jgi:hypothetical protein
MYAFRPNQHGRHWHRVVYLLYGPKYPAIAGAPIRNGWSLAHTSTTVYQSDELQERPEINFADELSNIYAVRVP